MHGHMIYVVFFVASLKPLAFVATLRRCSQYWQYWIYLLYLVWVQKLGDIYSGMTFCSRNS